MFTVTRCNLPCVMGCGPSGTSFTSLRDSMFQQVLHVTPLLLAVRRAAACVCRARRCRDGTGEEGREAVSTLAAAAALTGWQRPLHGVPEALRVEGHKHGLGGEGRGGAQLGLWSPSR